MGLDIFAASRIVKKKDGEIFIGDNESRCEYKSGEYSPGPGSTRHTFRAGSYSSYNAWRETLCKLMHGITPEEMWSQPDKWKGAAFQEVIDFSDSSGAIGARVSKKLFDDFKKHRSGLYKRAIEHFASDYQHQTREQLNRFFYVYDEFTTAFGVASDRGILIFG